MVVIELRGSPSRKFFNLICSDITAWEVIQESKIYEYADRLIVHAYTPSTWQPIYLHIYISLFSSALIQITAERKRSNCSLFFTLLLNSALSMGVVKCTWPITPARRSISSLPIGETIHTELYSTHKKCYLKTVLYFKFLTVFFLINVCVGINLTNALVVCPNRTFLLVAYITLNKTRLTETLNVKDTFVVTFTLTCEKKTKEGLFCISLHELCNDYSTG